MSAYRVDWTIGHLNICEKANSPCMNGGQCIQYSPAINYTCDCTGTGYEGINCTDLVACSMEAIVSSDRGTFEWPETMPDSTVHISCPNGPSGATANRTCTNNGTWESPGIESCATTVIFNQFKNISKVNITAENVVSVSENLTDLVVSTTDAADQNTDNIRTVSAILDQTAILLSDPMIIMNLSSSELSMTTENTVQILDSIEEWAPAVVEIESNNIINSFERIIDALINQDNFTNITVVENDIALKGESFQQAVFNGIEFTAASI
uniref:EGF-like domain-containing protein n=1 Tax=Amphimedon queenslandica TaxID=400682 RepID=A0A1X7SR64_AMPQE